MTGLNTQYVHRIAALIISAGAALSADQLQAEMRLGRLNLHQIHSQQAMDLRLEQQRHRSAHRPVTPREHFLLQGRYLEERLKQRALHERQLRNARLQGRIGNGMGIPTLRRTDRIRYQQQQTTQRLGFKMNRRP